MIHFVYLKFQLINNQFWQAAKAIINPRGPLFELAREQAKMKSKFTMSSSQSGIPRNDETKYQRQFMGSLAEIYVEAYLNELLTERNLKNHFLVQRYDNVRTDGFKSAINEYDLKIVNKKTRQDFTIESRSSIAYNRSIIKAIEQFDIIGPYSSTAKGNEKYNDFYIRPLYEVARKEQANYKANNFEKLVSSGAINLYIAGGCLKKDMLEKSYQKSMSQNNTLYTVVKIIKGYDAIKFKTELTNKIIKEKYLLRH
ncbi:MAG: hypothetical protein Q8891_09645 [Bacteroidota bacterium]|nr:hypothetical protein [Bacteroidota bacterium]